jgi:hypothetical protein
MLWSICSQAAGEDAKRLRAVQPRLVTIEVADVECISIVRLEPVEPASLWSALSSTIAERVLVEFSVYDSYGEYVSLSQAKQWRSSELKPTGTPGEWSVTLQTADAQDIGNDFVVEQDVTSDNGTLRLTLCNTQGIPTAGVRAAGSVAVVHAEGSTPAGTASGGDASSTLVPPGHKTLTDAEAADVADALSGGDPSEPLAEFQYIPVTRKSMWTLRQEQWLNDEVINYFLMLLRARKGSAPGCRHAPGRVHEDAPKCHVMQTSFYTKLACGPNGYCYKGVRRWTMKGGIDIFTMDLVIVPIHCHGNHWTLAVIYPKKRKLVYYDSLRGGPGIVLENLRQWLEDEHRDKKCRPFDAGGFKLEQGVRGAPLQRNGCDCGVFMTRTALYLAHGMPLDFDQGHMPYFRRLMVLEIMRKSYIA